MEYVERTYKICPEIITCRNCQFNYPMPCDKDKWTKHGRWCQGLSKHVCCGSIEEDKQRAIKCPYFMPTEFTKSFAKPAEEEPEQWYEKDTIA